MDVTKHVLIDPNRLNLAWPHLGLSWTSRSHDDTAEGFLKKELARLLGRPMVAVSLNLRKSSYGFSVSASWRCWWWCCFAAVACFGQCDQTVFLLAVSLCVFVFLLLQLLPQCHAGNGEYYTTSSSCCCRPLFCFVLFCFFLCLYHTPIAMLSFLVIFCAVFLLAGG